MIATPFWIQDRLAIVPRPRGGDWLDDEMLALRQANIDVVVSLLESPESTELGLKLEGEAAEAAGILFLNFSIPDRSVPQNLGEFNEFLSLLESHIAAGRRVGIHCRACIGRSSVVACSLLIRSGIEPEEAWDEVENAREQTVPDTKEQQLWVNRWIGLNP